MSLNRIIGRSKWYKTIATTYMGQHVYFEKQSYQKLLATKRKYHVTTAMLNQHFPNHENLYAYDIVASYFSENVLNSNRKITNEEEFQSFLNSNWRESNITDIVEAFKNAQQYCVRNDINLSDVRFDPLVDGLMDHCDKLTYSQLVDLLQCLSSYPACKSYSAHNIHDMWSCMDDICIWNMQMWDLDQQLTIAMFWHRWNLSKYSDFIYNVIDRTVKKAQNLTKDQLVSIFFMFNMCRRRSVDFEYEYALEKLINEMTVDEIAVVALGYFKTKSSIKLLSILEVIIEKVTSHSKDIHEISLSAIMKVLRYSKPGKLIKEITVMMDKLYPELDRLSNTCCLHVSLLFTCISWMSEDILNKIAEKLSKDMSNLRLKDIERLLHVLSMFQFYPKNAPNIFEEAYEELHKDSRLREITTHYRSLLSTLNYLSLEEIYSYSLLNKILDMDYIKLTYGRSRTVPRELFALDCSIDIDCPDYNGNRLPLDIRYKAAKWHTEFLPFDPLNFKKNSVQDEFFMTVYNNVVEIVGHKNLVYPGHVFPHYSKGVIVVCKNTENGRFVEPIGFQKYVLGDIMVPFKDNSLKWFAVMVVSWNNTIRDTSLLLGHARMEERQLRKVGYHPVLAIWNQFLKLTPEKQKMDLYTKLQ